MILLYPSTSTSYYYSLQIIIINTSLSTIFEVYFAVLSVLLYFVLVVLPKFFVFLPFALVVSLSENEEF